MALNLPDAPAPLDVDAELTAALEPGTGTDLEDPDRPVRGLLRRRHGQVEELLALAVAIAAAAADLEVSTGQLRTDVDAIDTTGAGPAPDLSGYATTSDLATRYVRPDTGIPLSDLTAAGVAALRQRSTHTGVQPVATVENLQVTLDAITMALAGKAATVHAHVAADVTDATAVGRSLLKSADAAAARGAVGAAALVHTHVVADVSDATTVGRSLLKAADAPAARATLGITAPSPLVIAFGAPVPVGTPAGTLVVELSA